MTTNTPEELARKLASEWRRRNLWPHIEDDLADALRQTRQDALEEAINYVEKNFQDGVIAVAGGIRRLL